MLKSGEDLAILSVGSIASEVEKCIEMADQQFNLAHYDLRFVKPLDETLMKSIFDKFENIITIEDATVTGGFGDAVLEFAQNQNYKGRIYKLGIPDQFIEHGETHELYDLAGISAAQILKKVKSILL